ncbi:recombinase family protein [Minwuia thermotolerans]|uniref:Resolvase n=1 Tax=Minwuia thermotolerans TaxID=2056226 RepID=A0A2M9FW52_9PROT|nr:recombinase family protein [Minwuia thermotolerans]PJK27684.1 resolvase [Minwuia thermotolerans]
MLIGYARVSKSDDQNTTAQVTALREAGCETIYQEAASGGRWDRPELQKLLDYLRAGDVVVVWKLDRLSRSLRDLLFIMEKLDAAGAGFRSLTESIDTTSPGGRMLMQMLGSFAEFEREMIRERTRAGLERARKEGRVGGRRPKLTAEQQREAIEAVRSGRRTASQMARVFDVHPATISRVVKASAAFEST